MRAPTAAALLLLAAPLAFAGPCTIYVNNVTGNDANDGSAEHPCATIQQGIKLGGCRQKPEKLWQCHMKKFWPSAAALHGAG